MGRFHALLALLSSSTLLAAQNPVAQDPVAQDPAAADPQPRLDEQRFAELQRRLLPDPEAPWRSIPWRIDLLAAQHEAAAQQKPLFVWAMDGHPLGCT
ncbi:MAG TPA: hypothetical protein VFZ65_23120 [Planctomycetota bacterium]|nr:hypothetical protein [Planctomycetota bacterium]